MTDILRLQADGGTALSLSTLGAAWLSCEVPMPDGTRRSVVLQRDDPPGEAARKAFLGATIGRYANRIGHARIADGPHVIALQPDPGSRHQLHGGPQGFHSRHWTVAHVDDRSIRFSIVSEDGDQGYPGELRAQVTYRLADAMTVEIEATATTTARSPVCLTNHAYFNLDGIASDVRTHPLRIAANRYLPVDADLIPLGRLADVQGTGFDFRSPKALMTHWMRDEQQRIAGGYDHAYLLDPACAAMASPAAVLTSTDGRLRLAMSTTLPALQLYGGQFLEGIPSPDGRPHAACAGIALEPEFLPDSPNHPEWPQPSCWLNPGEVYRHVFRYEFLG
ncbi:galactose-1-epimerase [Piscinibacter sp.]|uniref:galactose-1-epimerase n=1 Tax=Piscinibacter sp. TaxID=1903157 RepID=UPI002CA2AEA7|nr:galactose-1-epimerase [Albitalea sp.]HUG26343.1 galactose-1-epimerase [Albitalea sp.]